MRKLFIFSFLFFCYISSFSQIVEGKNYDNFKRIEFLIENDVFNRTDHYYTNGLIINYSNPTFAKSFFFKLFSPSKNVQFDRYGIGFLHKMYTPIAKNKKPKFEEDRPFASYFLFHLHKETRKEVSKSSNYFQVGLGLLGTDAKGKELQNLIHKILPENEVVLGWDTQVKNEFLFDIQYTYEKGIFHNNYFDFIALGNIQAGTLRDNLGIGAKLRFGWKPNYYTQYISKGRRLGDGIYMYSDIEWNSRWVLYDATLSGGTLHSKDNIFVLSSNQIKDFVHEARISLNFRYKKFKLGFMQTVLSPEFDVGKSHQYGGFLFQIEF